MADFTLFANWTASSSASLVMGGRYHTLQTMAQLVIILSRYVTIPYLLLFQKASPNWGSYCNTRERQTVRSQEF